MLATWERGGIKFQTALLKTAWAAFVWTFKTQQLKASIVCRGKYANSKHISHHKPFQSCHRWDMKDDKSGEKGEACIYGSTVIVRRERGWIGLTSLVTREAPGLCGFPWVPAAPKPCWDPITAARAGVLQGVPCVSHPAASQDRSLRVAISISKCQPPSPMLQPCNPESVSG